MSARIAIPCREASEPGGSRVLAAVQMPYIEAIIEAGGVPLLVPPTADEKALAELFTICDGILLAGGEDVEPSRYGEEPHPKLGRVSPVRDAVEIAFARWAVEQHKPLLAICRGLQVLNVACGGSLIQDLEAQAGCRGHDIPTRGIPENWGILAHSIEIDHDSLLARLLGTETLEVNSLHHQAIDRLGIALRIVARSTDGTVEAVESAADHPFLLGVQCHPEALYASIDRRWSACFSAFVQAANARRQGV
jgi:putative glutamine amidotransferase